MKVRWLDHHVVITVQFQQVRLLIFFSNQIFEFKHDENQVHQATQKFYLGLGLKLDVRLHKLISETQ